MKKNVLLVYGGGGTEHEVSMVSSQFVKSQIDDSKYDVFMVLIDKNKKWYLEQNGKKTEVQLNFNRELIVDGKAIPMHMSIPVIHGYPGETGEIQGYFDMISLPYVGCDSESSKICFNKITTKIWLDKLGIANTPYIFVTSLENAEMDKARKFFKEHGGKVFVKASNQGSSVGCYKVLSENELISSLKDAFKYSPFVLVEKLLSARELEVSAYEYDGQVVVTGPGEIVCPSGFYTYEEKYSKDSKTETLVTAPGLKPEMIAQMKEMGKKAFLGLKLRHLSRIDFFLEGNTLYLNEINTFPGHTPISMFPMMMENNGHSYRTFLNKILALL